MSKIKIAVLVGSLRENSYSKQLARVLTTMFSDQFELHVVDTTNLELYNPDLETENPPVGWTVFREKMQESDAVLFVTPEYNRTIPAVLKNALDVGSQPPEKNVFDDKPGAIVSVAGGSIGGFGANHHLRQAVVYLNVLLMQVPEAYIASIHTLFNDDGELIKESTYDYLRLFVDAFEQWIYRVQR